MSSKILLFLGAAAVLMGTSQAAISCWLCDQTISDRGPLDCLDPASGYLGVVIQCKGNEYESENICLKTIGTPQALGVTSDVGEVVTRGCISPSLESPWGEEGEWEEKNRCKEYDDGTKVCTCKDNHMCNGAPSAGPAGAWAALAAAAAALALRAAA